jgi:hypothetical protein
MGLLGFEPLYEFKLLAEIITIGFEVEFMLFLIEVGIIKLEFAKVLF